MSIQKVGVLLGLLLFPVLSFAQHGLSLAPFKEPVQDKTKSEPMTFTISEECNSRGCFSVMLAKGEIDQSSPDELAAILQKGPMVERIYLDSPGGRLLPALKMGLLIRKMGIDTTLKSGMVCISACAYTFMGGFERRLEGGVLGVHRFYGSEESNEVSQEVMGVLSSYFDQIGVQREVLEVISKTSSNTIHRFDLDEAKRYNIDNHPTVSSPWSMTASEKGLVLQSRGPSYGSDRQALFSLGQAKDKDQVLVHVLFTEPLLSSSYRREQELKGQHGLLLCRISTEEQTDFSEKNCITGKQILPWETQNARQYDTIFSVSMAELKQLAQGNRSDILAFGVYGGFRHTAMVFLSTKSSGFKESLDVLLKQSQP